MFSAKRTVAKTVVSVTYHTALSTASTVALKAAVQPEEDSTEESLCELGGLAIGTAIWWKTTARVESIVDVVADRRAARKVRKQQSTEK
jgi:hypothetical protein